MKISFPKLEKRQYLKRPRPTSKKREGVTGLRSVSELTGPIPFHSLWCISAAWVANGGFNIIKNDKKDLNIGPFKSIITAAAP